MKRKIFKLLVALVLVASFVRSLSLAAGESLPDVVAKPGWDDLPPVTVDASTTWPWWRGPTHDGVSAAGQEPVLAWGEQTNLLWRAELPGSGHGSPCILGGRIYLAAGDTKESVIWVLAFDQASGKKLWQTEVYRGALPTKNKNNSLASSTLACDGERLFFPYQTDREVRLAALTLDGKVAWDRSYGAYQSVQGFCASPAIWHSAVVLAVEGKANQQLTALHRKTGELVWRCGRMVDGESYASPTVARIAGRDQVVVAGCNRTRSYDAMTGAALWDCAGPAATCVATAAFNADTVFVAGGYPQRALLAIRTDGSGDVTATHLRWKDDQKCCYIPSLLYRDGLLYELIDKGLLRCYDAEKGTLDWEYDLKAAFYSSPVLVGDRIYLFDQTGKGYVFKAGRQCELLATNDLAPGVYATPVFLNNRMYLRTLKALYCFGTP